MNDSNDCRVCGSVSRPFATVKVLRKYDVAYFECPRCGFVQTEKPYWLTEAYAEAIVEVDIGPVQRAWLNSSITKAVILGLFDPAARFVDYGGGFGLFVRTMRDKGFDFRIHEKYCENLFARGFELAAAPEQKCELLTAFELFEHLVDPFEDIQRMLEFSESLLFTTELLPPSRPRPGQWWYYVPEFGQHISIYTTAALESIAARLGLRLYSDGAQMHLLTRRQISERRFRFLIRPRVAAWLDLLRTRPSLLPADVDATFARAGISK